MMDKYLTIFNALEEELDLDDMESVRKSKDPDLAKWYSAIGLLGMSAKEIGKEVSSGAELGEKLNTALQDRYRDNDELKKEVENALEILKKTISDTTLIFNKYTVNYEIAIRALTDSNEAKDKIIEDRDETIRRIRRERVEKTISQVPEAPAPEKHNSETPEKDVPEDPVRDVKSEGVKPDAEKSERLRSALGAFLKRADKASGASDGKKYPSDEGGAGRGIPDAGKDTSPDGDGGTAGRASEELGNFIDLYINNEEYSEEARSYLLSCYQSGTSLDVIRQFARPQFSVKIMKRLKRIYERRNL